MNKLLVSALLMSFSSAAMSMELGCGFESIPEDQVVHGCGCGYYKKDMKGFDTLFQSDFGEAPRMYYQGELVALDSAQSNNQAPLPQNGEHFKEAFTFGDYEISYDSLVSSVCPKDGEGCGVTTFNSTLIISGPSCRAEIEKIEGDCGC